VDSANWFDVNVNSSSLSLVWFSSGPSAETGVAPRGNNDAARSLKTGAAPG
jgi:hypothetical protein